MAPLRVLYAEDSEADADLTRSEFDRVGGFELEIVNTGHECLARLHRHTYDALLLDNQLLDMEGTEVLRALAARDLSLPIVVVTAVGDESLVVQVLRMGASDYVPKYGNYLERLPAIVRTVIAEHRRLGPYRRAARRPLRRVLYVEHDPLDVDLALKHLRATASHLSIEIASSCRDALARLPRGAFDLVLADLRMPDMSALDLFNEARHAGIRLPFIVITGRGDEEA
ncbi:MAG: response regulator, partial [Vicinamibacterales bacterium]